MTTLKKVVTPVKTGVQILCWFPAPAFAGVTRRDDVWIPVYTGMTIFGHF